MDYQDYAEIKALNYSTLKLIGTSPKYLRHMCDNVPVETDAFRLGRAVHCAILEPDVFVENYVAQPNFGDMRTKSAKEKKAEWENALPSEIEILKHNEYSLCTRQAEAIWKHPVAAGLMRGGVNEKTLLWNNGVDCKGRVDCLTQRVIDIKTTRQTSVDAVYRDIVKYDYHVQLAWYHDACVRLGLIDGHDMPAIVAVHGAATSEYSDVAVFELSPQTLESGRRTYSRWIDTYIGCTQADWWPGMAEQVIQLNLPTWKQVEDEDNE